MTDDSQFLNPELAERAREACLSVGTRLLRISVFEEAAAKVNASSGVPGNRGWRRWSLSSGYTGAALCLEHLGRALQCPEMTAAARDYLNAAINSLALADPSDIGVIDGIAGVCFAARLVDPKNRFTGRLLSHLEQHLAAGTEARADEVDGATGMPFKLFDAVSGLAGIGRYWLFAQGSAYNPGITARCVEVLTRLINEQTPVPRWYTPSGLNADKSLRKRFPRGTLNCGLAHGLPGVIAFLSLAVGQGIGGESSERSLRNGVEWLLGARTYDEYGPNWPTVVPLVDEPLNLPGARAAWCYGAPGVCRALWLAASALNEPSYKAAALEALHAVHRRPKPLLNIPSPTFCHGLAGLLHITVRFARDTGDPSLRQAAELLTAEIMGSYVPDAPLHFQDVEFTRERVDRPGMLEGACGVALALSFAISPMEPTWDALLLLS